MNEVFLGAAKFPCQSCEKHKAAAKRTYDFFTQKGYCPFGAPGHLRPCAGKPIEERQCKACIAEFCGYEEEMQP